MWAIIVLLSVGLFNMFQDPKKINSEKNKLPFSSFMNEVESWAKKLAKRSPLVAKETKELLRYSKYSDYWSTFNKEIKIQANLAKTDDFKNAVKAFFNKEKPKFSGK